MVTSSELCTIVTTSDNSFLVWGSRPVIKTPLGEILEKGEEGLKKNTPLHKVASNDTPDNVFSEDKETPGTPHRKHLTRATQSSVPIPIASRPSFDSQQPPGSSSVEGSPAKHRSNDSISKIHAPVKNSTSENITHASKGSLQMIGKRNPSLNFSEVPHTLVPCTDCSQYLKTLSSILCESLDSSSRGKPHPLKRESLSGAHLSTSHRRGTSTSSVQQLTGRDVIIMHPHPMDLVGKSGILNLLSVEGITAAKLEGLSCYGSNVLVLIQAQVVTATTCTSGDDSRQTERQSVELSRPKELPTFKIGRKLIQRANLRLVQNPYKITWLLIICYCVFVQDIYTFW